MRPYVAEGYSPYRDVLVGAVMTAMRSSGIWLSGIMHLIILLIPVSMHIAKRLDFRDVELFVMDETAPVTKTVTIPKKLL